MNLYQRITGVLALVISSLIGSAQDFPGSDRLIWSPDSAWLTGVRSAGSAILFSRRVPLVSFMLNGKRCNTSMSAESWGDKLRIRMADTSLEFANISTDTVVVSNPVPFGDDSSHVYITGLGDHPLSRTYIFLPGKSPVNVIVPDDAWDLGYCSFAVGGAFDHDPVQIAALLRRNRQSVTNGRTTRFETILYPGGSVRYRW